MIQPADEDLPQGMDQDQLFPELGGRATHPARDKEHYSPRKDAKYTPSDSVPPATADEPDMERLRTVLTGLQRGDYRYGSAKGSRSAVSRSISR